MPRIHPSLEAGINEFRRRILGGDVTHNAMSEEERAVRLIWVSRERHWDLLLPFASVSITPCLLNVNARCLFVFSDDWKQQDATRIGRARFALALLPLLCSPTAAISFVVSHPGIDND